MNIRKTLRSLPKPFQKIIKSTYGLLPISLRFGKVFWQTYNFLQESQWWSRKELENYQMAQLNKLLLHAYNNVPYYQNLFIEQALKPEDIQSLDDLKKVPFLTKDMVRERSRDLTAKNYDIKDLYISHTSGTTGKPLQWYISLEEDQKEYASICHQWSRVGFNPGDSTVQLRGNIIDNKKRYEYDPAYKVLRLSPKFYSKEIINYYLKLIKDFGAKFIHGYPSVISLFASLIKEYNLQVPFELKAILFASEAIYSWEKQISGEVFKCRIFSHYGNAEKVTLAGECEKTERYHPIPQYGITEIGGDNQIIGTSLINYVTPFIRYKTTDIVSGVNNDELCSCKRQYFPSFDSVEGRLEDYIITPRGEFISPAVLTHPFKDFQEIRNTQIVQKTAKFIELRVVPNEKHDLNILKSEINILISGLNKILSNDMEIKPEIVDTIETSASGKFRWIISEISKKSLEKGII
jgi:phenylacetate-CoA ligase